MKKSLGRFLPLAAVVLLTACAEKGSEILGPGSQGNIGESVVSLTVGSDASKSGVAAHSTGSRIVADLSKETGIAGLVLVESVSDMDAMSGQMLTKGTPVYTENFADIYSEGFNAVMVYDNDTKEPLEELCGALFKKREGSNMWFHDYTGKTLPEKGLFYFTAPATLPSYITIDDEDGYDPETGSMTFQLVPANYPTTATAQQDILFGNALVGKGKSANVMFYHAFADVKFKQGNTDGKMQITKVTISHQPVSGSCTVTPATGAKSATVSVWTPAETTEYKEFSQEYDGNYSYTDDGYFDESFYEAGAERNLNIDGDTKATTTFMCVPQTFSKSDTEPVIVTIEYKVGEETRTAQVDLSSKLDNKSWDAGKLYTYSFNISDLGVTVDNESSEGVISDVVITNTGNMKGYIRASIVANWKRNIDDVDVVVQSCNLSEMEIGTNWIKGTDGYYYYKYGVNGGNATKQPIFDSFTAGDAPVSGAYLQMNILAQIIADRDKWNATLPAGLEDTEDVDE